MVSGVIWDVEREAVLKEMNDGKYNWRTVEGIAEDTKLPTAKVELIFKTLTQEGLVKRSDTNLRHWGLVGKVKNTSYGWEG